MDKVLEALLQAVEILEEHEVPYAVTGSFASAYHGYVRATEDVDLAIQAEEQGRLEDISEDLSTRIRRVDAKTWNFPGDVTVELYPARETLEQVAIEERVRGQLRGEVARDLWFVPLETLLVLKVREHVRHGQGLKHLADIQQLIARNQDTLDREKLERLLALNPDWERAWKDKVEQA